MGLLDDLKKQAELVKTQQLSQQSILEENIKLVEARMQQAFQYLHELLKQLAVLKPTNPIVYTIPGAGDLRNLGFVDSFIDYRKKKIGDKDYFDTILLFVKWATPETLTVERDMPAAIQKLNDVLWGSGIKFTEEKIKKPGGSFEKMKFTIPCKLTCDITITADHANARLLVKGKHFFRLGMDELRIPAGEVDETLLEEFAKMLIGQPSALRKYRGAAL